MSRIEKSERRKRALLQSIFTLLCLGITFGSLVYARLVDIENNEIRQTVDECREIPLDIKIKLGIR